MYLADDFRTLAYFTEDSLMLEDIFTGQKFEFVLANELFSVAEHNDGQNPLLDCIYSITLGHLSASDSGEKHLNVLVTLSNKQLKAVTENCGLGKVPDEE